jgi:hypothetical protein
VQAIRTLLALNGAVAPALGSRLWVVFLTHAIERIPTAYDGGVISDAFQAIQQLGLPPESVWPYSDSQDGNFKVGNLFGVQQATGIITLSASQFGLSGLSSLSLGGIALGSSSVVITQFSTDSSFTSNSDGIIPTQRAIRSYLSSRLSQGGANTFTGQITAGTVVVGGPNYIRSSIPAGQAGSSVNVQSKMYINANGVDGNIVALHYFIRWGAHRTFTQ